MQPAPDNKATKPLKNRRDPDPAAGYLVRCGCKGLVTLPLSGVIVQCLGCGMRWAWREGQAKMGRRHL